MVSLAVVFFNVESLDTVYQARVEVKELDEIQEEVNKFNIKEGASSMSLIQSVQSILKDQRYITYFARELAILPKAPIENYVKLRDDLASRCDETWAATSIRRLTVNARSLSNASELLELEPLTGRASRRGPTYVSDVSWALCVTFSFGGARALFGMNPSRDAQRKCSIRLNVSGDLSVIPSVLHGPVGESHHRGRVCKYSTLASPSRITALALLGILVYRLTYPQCIHVDCVPGSNFV